MHNAGVLQVCSGARHSGVGQLWHQQLNCQRHAQETGHIWHSCHGITCSRFGAESSKQKSLQPGTCIAWKIATRSLFPAAIVDLVQRSRRADLSDVCNVASSTCRLRIDCSCQLQAIDWQLLPDWKGGILSVTFTLVQYTLMLQGVMGCVYTHKRQNKKIFLRKTMK